MIVENGNTRIDEPARLSGWIFHHGTAADQVDQPPYYDTYIKSHLGGALLRRKRPARLNVGIDRDRAGAPSPGTKFLIDTLANSGILSSLPQQPN